MTILVTLVMYTVPPMVQNCVILYIFLQLLYDFVK